MVKGDIVTFVIGMGETLVTQHARFVRLASPTNPDDIVPAKGVLTHATRYRFSQFLECLQGFFARFQGRPRHDACHFVKDILLQNNLGVKLLQIFQGSRKGMMALVGSQECGRGLIIEGRLADNVSQRHKGWDGGQLLG
jgi:hypothetical protein